jgi:hypothetical protein
MAYLIEQVGRTGNGTEIPSAREKKGYSNFRQAHVQINNKNT